MRRLLLPVLLTLTLILAACASGVATPASPQTGPQPFDPAHIVPMSLREGKPAPVSMEPASPETDPANLSGDLTRIDQQGAIIVEITPLNLDAPADTLEFDVVMDTHSIDLSMDLATLATLTTDTGITVQATLWDAPRGGHHVEGKLIFPALQKGKSILDGATKQTLTIDNVDAPSRVFEWQLK
ncbi:MAG: hypothetical protein Q7T47_05430 [Anaerolineales bacterium]|nr:hypothetical protein [Anaerolineales bacterium]